MRLYGSFVPYHTAPKLKLARVRELPAPVNYYSIDLPDPYCSPPVTTMHLANENSSGSYVMDQLQNSILSIARCSVISYRTYALSDLFSPFSRKLIGSTRDHIPCPTINYVSRRSTDYHCLSDEHLIHWANHIFRLTLDRNFVEYIQYCAPITLDIDWDYYLHFFITFLAA